jgi:hypothetical protein
MKKYYPPVDYNYIQLIGALGCLYDNDVELDYLEIIKELREICSKRNEGDDAMMNEFYSKIKELHSKYRKMCLELGLIRTGELFNKDDASNLMRFYELENINS